MYCCSSYNTTHAPRSSPLVAFSSRRARGSNNNCFIYNFLFFHWDNDTINTPQSPRRAGSISDGCDVIRLTLCSRARSRGPVPSILHVLVFYGRVWKEKRTRGSVVHAEYGPRCIIIRFIREQLVEWFPGVRNEECLSVVFRGKTSSRRPKGPTSNLYKQLSLYYYQLFSRTHRRRYGRYLL